MMDTRDLFDRAAPTYDLAAFPFFTPFGEALVEFAQLGPEDHVLDAGCGTGAVLASAYERGGSAAGIELSPAMAERARAAAPGADVLVGDAAALPFPDGAFDVVLSGFVVFFIQDPTAALREWRRVLAPGGRLAISTWGESDPRWQTWERPLRGSFVPEMDPAIAQELGAGLAQVDRFSDEAKLEAELSAAGFGSIEVAEHVIEFVFPDEEAWWDWNLSHGSRVFIDALPPDARERLRAQMFEAMQQVRDERGFPRRYKALFTSAKPRP